jgi:hypothetical protein
MNEAENGGTAGELPLFDERYRWVLLQSLRWLRQIPEIDLDEAEQLDAAYGFLSGFVQDAARRRGIAGKLDAVKVAIVAESDSARATVEKILLDWVKSK